MTKVRVGYVPEHFAAPLLQLADSDWGKQNIQLVLQPSGTGQMLTSLDASQSAGQQIDVAVALTEALIAGIAKGRTDYKLVGSYVRTSLNWAVITGADPKADKYQSISDLRGTKIGISRIGSGSQLMASVMALDHGWTNGKGDVDQIEFVVNDTFENLRKGVNQVDENSATSCFMWEWFTTKPYQDSGEVRFIGSVPTPWPSWTIAASANTALSSSTDQLNQFLAKLLDSVRSFANPQSRQDGSAAQFIINHHSYKPQDVESWLNGVRWAGEQTPNPTDRPVPQSGQNTTPATVSQQTVVSTLGVLEKAGVLTKPVQGWNLDLFVDSPSRLVE